MALFTWGLGKSGQLGSGKKENAELPLRISVCGPGQRRAATDRVLEVAAGGLYTALLTADGRVFTTGSGAHGRLATGAEQDVLAPQQVEALNGLHITKISCGSWHGGAVTKDGLVYLWGYSKAHGVLGVQAVPQPYAPPLPLTSLPGQHVIGITCGNNYSMVWTNSGEIFSWGCGRHGVLGHGDETDKLQPARINIPFVTHADAGFAHSGIVVEDGTVWMMGTAKYGALGRGKKQSQKTPVCTPTLVLMPPDVMFKEVSCSKGENHGHTLAVTHTGQVYAWGDGYKGKLGLGNQDYHWQPTLISQEYFSGEDIVGVSAGGIHSSAVSADGHVYTWGCGSDGRLGHPEVHGHRYLFRSDTPRVVEALSEHGHAVAVKASYYHTVAIVRPKHTLK